MGNKQTFAEITGIIELYFDGLYHANSTMLADAFHPDARYVNALDGDYMNYSMPEYFSIIDKRTPPARSGITRADNIISIELGGENMAFAKVTMTMLGREYLDFLTLTHSSLGWRIISKIFSYQSKPQEA